MRPDLRKAVGVEEQCIGSDVADQAVAGVGLTETASFFQLSFPS